MTDKIMILLFPLLDFLPFALPRYLLFRDRLRLPFQWVVLLISCLCAANSVTFYLLNTGGSEQLSVQITLLRYAFLVLNLILSFTLIRDNTAGHPVTI